MFKETTGHQPLNQGAAHSIFHQSIIKNLLTKLFLSFGEGSHHNFHMFEEQRGVVEDHHLIFYYLVASRRGLKHRHHQKGH